MNTPDYLHAALVCRAALDKLIAFEDERKKADFPYSEVRDAAAAFIGRSREDLPPYEVMIQQQRAARAWIELLFALESRMLHAHHKER